MPGIEDLISGMNSQQVNVNPNDSFFSQQNQYQQNQGQEFQQQSPVPGVELPKNNPDITSALSQSDIGQFSDRYLMANDADRELMKLIDSQHPITPETGNLGSETYFPGLHDPILKGQSSSKTLGSQPIFVRSGGYIPYGVMDARKQALQNAAIERAKQLRAFDMPKIPGVKDPRFQENINKTFDSIYSKHVAEAQQLYGDKAFAMLQDPRSSVGRKFNQALDNLDVLARETDQVTDLIADIEKNQAEGSKVYSDRTNDLKNQYLALQGQFLGGKTDVNIRKTLNELKGAMTLDKYLNDEKILTNLEAEVRAGMAQFTDKGDFYEARKYTKTTVRNQAKQIAERLKGKGGAFAHNDFYTAKDIEDAVVSMIGDKIDVETKTINKPSGSGGGYDYTNKKEINVQPVRNLDFGLKNKEGEFRAVTISNIVDLKERGNQKPWKITGGVFYEKDPETGLLSPVTKSVDNFEPASIGDVSYPEYNEDGSEKMSKASGGVAGFLVTKDELGKEVRTPTILRLDESTEAKIRNEVPVSFDVYKENSETGSGEGIKSTTTIKTDRSGNEISKSTTKSVSQEQPKRTSINRSEISSKAQAAGYTPQEYEKLLISKGIKIEG